MAFDAGDIEGRLTLDRTPFQAGLRLARQEAQRFERDKIIAKLDLKDEGVKRELDRISRQRVSPKATLDVTALRREIRSAEAALDDLDRAHASPEVSLQTARMRAELARLKADLARMEADDVEIDVDVKRGAAERIADIAGSAGMLTKAFGSAGDAASNFGGASTSVGGQTAMVSARMGALAAVVGGPLVAALGIAVAAVGALTASFAFAAGGAGALGAALLASLGPALVLILGVASRVAAVMEAKQAATQAATAATGGAAAASQEAAAAAEREYQAAIALRDAREGLTRAQRNYAQAVDQAREDIRDGLRDQVEAQRDVADAGRDLARAEQEVRSARQQAARSIAAANRTVAQSWEDVTRAAEEAKRAQTDATQDAERAANDLASTQLDQADAAEAVAAAQAALNAIRSGYSMGGPQDLADAEEALQRALIAQSDAALDLTDAEERLADATKTVNDYAKEGPMAYGPYRAAVEALTQAIAKAEQLQRQGVAGNPAVVSALDAQRDARQRLAGANRQLAEATRTANQLQRQGIAGNPQVVAAAEAVRDAQQQLAQAHHQAEQAAKRNATALGGASAAALDAKKKLADLSEAEREFLGVIGQVATTFRQVLQPATDAVLRGMSGAARILMPTFRALQPAFTQLGRAWGDVMIEIARAMRDLRPEFDQLIRFTAELSRAGGKVFKEFLRVFIRLGVAAMPLLIAGMRSVERLFAGWARGAKDAEGLRRSVGGLVDHLASWLKLGGAISQVFLAFFSAAAPAGKSMVDSLTLGARALAQWMRSAQDQKVIRDFFRDMLPLISEFAKLMGRLVIIGFQLLRAFAPALTAMLRGFNFVLKPVSFLLGLFNKIPGSIRQFLHPMGLVHAAFRLWLGIFHTLGNVASRVFGDIRGSARAVATGVVGSWKALRGGTVAAWNAIRAVTRAAWNAIRNTITTAARTAANTVRSIWTALRNALREIWNATRNIARATWNAIKDVITNTTRALSNSLRSTWRNLRDFLRDTWNGIRRIASDLWGRIKDAITKPLKAGADRIKDIWRDVKGFLRDIWDDIKVAGEELWSWVKAGARSAANGMISIFNAAIRLINKITPGEIDPPGPGPKIPAIPDIGEIPYLALGGIFRKAGFAVVGEHGPELASFPTGARVDPLPQPLMSSPALGAGGVGGRGWTIEQLTIEVVGGNGEPDVRDLASKLNTAVRNLGGMPAGGTP